MSNYYNIFGKPIDKVTYQKFRKDVNYCIVARNPTDAIYIHTEWIGCDPNWVKDSPLLFKTTVLFHDNPMLSPEEYWSETLEHALACHERLCKAYNIFPYGSANNPEKQPKDRWEALLEE
jgi:hypothetical protein